MGDVVLWVVGVVMTLAQPLCVGLCVLVAAAALRWARMGGGDG